MVNWRNDTIVFLAPGSVGIMDKLQSTLSSWMNLAGTTEEGSAGFYCADWGPIPFVLGRPPRQAYYVLKVFSRLQFRSRSASQTKLPVGGVPTLAPAAPSGNKPALLANPWQSPDSEIAAVDLAEETRLLVNPEVQARLVVARQLLNDGKVEEAIEHYRETVRLYPDNAVALSLLAWVLATNDRPELRDGQEAVRLAERAVKLTDHRQPIFIGTLAVAYAETGQFSRAVELAQNADDLVFLTGQKELVMSYKKLLELCAAGKAANSARSR